MNKFFKFMLVFAATAFLFVACDEKDPIPTPDKPTPENPTPENPTPENPTPEDPVAEADWCDFYFKVEASCDVNALYQIGEFDLTTLTNKDGKTIHEVLGFSSFEEFSVAVGTKADALNFDREVILFGYDLGAEMEYQNAYNNNGYGYWVDANSNPVGYGENAKCYIEMYDDDGNGLDPIGTFGVMNQNEGETLNACIIFQRTVDGTVTTAGLHVIITVQAFVDPEEGKYSGVCTPGTYEYTVNETMSVAAYPYYAALVLNVEELQAKIGLTKYQISQIENQYDDNEEFFSGIIVETLHADGTPNTFVDANGNEVYSNWVNAEGKAVAWQAPDAVMCFNPITTFEGFGASVCVEPNNTNGPHTDESTGETYGTSAVNDAIGKTISFMMKFTYIPEEAYGDITQGVVATVTYNVTLAE